MSRYCQHGIIADMCCHAECDPSYAAKEQAPSPSDAAACSRFADTPETNAHLGSHSNSPDDTAMWLQIGIPRRFERERNAALSSLAELHAALIRYEADVDGEAPSEHHRMMNRAAALLSENAPAQATTPAPTNDDHGNKQ